MSCKVPQCKVISKIGGWSVKEGHLLRGRLALRLGRCRSWFILFRTAVHVYAHILLDIVAVIDLILKV